MRALVALLTIAALGSLVEGVSRCSWGPSYWCKSQSTATECDKLSYCQESVWSLKEEVDGSIKCFACKEAVKKIEGFIETNATEEEMMVEIEKVCTILGPLETSCRGLIESNFKSLWNIVTQELNDQEICQLLKFCQESKSPKALQGASVSPMCQLCQEGVSEMAGLMKNHSPHTVELDLEKICTVFPGTAKDDCVNFIKENFNSVWKMIENQVDNKKICMEIHLCSSLSAPKVSIPKKPVVKVGDACDVCKTVVGFIKAFVDANSSEAEVKDALEKLCSMLPGNTGTECDKLVDDYFDTIWALVKSEVDSGDICKQIGLCNSTAVLTKQKPVLKADVDACGICKMVVSFLKHFVDENSTEEEVEKAIVELCKLLPSSVGSEIRGLVEQYFPMVWPLVKSEFNNDAICQQIEVCKDRALVTKQKPVLKVEVKEDICDFCKTVASFLKHFVDENSTETEAKEALETICKLLPGNYGQECSKYVTDDFQLVWGLIKGEIDSGLICQLVKACNSTSVFTKQKPFLKVGVKEGLCDFCKMVAGVIKPYVDSSSDEAEAKAALDTVCSVLPKNISQQCTTLVDTYFDVIWGAVKNEVDSGNACEDIGLCNNTAVFTKQKPVVKVGDSACDLCKLVVSYLKHWVDANSSEAEVKDALEKLCSLLPGNTGTECDNFVEKNFDMIWKLLQNEVDGGEVCKMIGLCNSTLVTPKLKPVVKVGDACSVCKTVVYFIKHFVDANSSEAEVKDALETLCKVLPGTAGTDCDKIVEENFDTIWKFLQGEFDSGTICNILKVCVSTSAVPKLSAPQVLNSEQFKSTRVLTVKSPDASIECVLCEFVMKEVDGLLTKNATEAEIVAALDKVCSILPSTVKTECDGFVKQYAPMIIQLLLQEANPQTVCTAIGLCKSKVPAITTKIEASIECVLCEFVMKELDSVLTKNSTEAEIVAALEKVCSILPSTIRTECDEFVKQYAPMIFDLLVNNTDPQEVCTLIKLCSSKVPAMTTQTESGPVCAACELVAKEFENILSENSSKTEIIEVLETICRALPGNISKECVEYVKDYGMTIITEITTELTAKDICTFLKLCTSQMLSTKVEAKPKVTAGPECVLCEFVIKEVDSLIGDNATQAEIVADLEKVCSILPSTVKDLCDTFVDTYGDQIIQLLLNKLDPKDVCTALGLCSSAIKEVTAGPECVLCEFVIKEVDSLIGDNATEAEIVAALDKVCSILPSTIKTECVTFINQYAPDLINVLVQKLDPKTVCTDLKLCSSAIKKAETGILCVVCEFVLKELFELIPKNATEEVIREGLDKVCSFLPSTFTKECDEFVGNYTDQIVKIILNNGVSKAVCTLLKLCLFDSQLPSRTAIYKTPKSSAVDKCSICKDTLDVIKTVIETKPAEGVVEDVLKDACEHLPVEIRAECSAIVVTYKPQIAQLVGEVIKPDAFCKDVKLCTGRDSKKATKLLMNPWMKLARRS